MTRDDILRIAREAGMTSLSLIDIGYLEKFAALVAAAEREALRLVLCDGITQSEAAKRAGIPRPNVTRQVASARRMMALARVLIAPPP